MRRLVLVALLLAGGLVVAVPPDGSRADSNPLTGAIGVSAGVSHTCAVMDTSALKCWGNNQYGQVGDGSVTSRALPVDVYGMENGVLAVAAGSTHTCAVMGTGALKCWGNNEYGQLGDGTRTDRAIPTDVVGLANGVVAVTAGDLHTCAVTKSYGVKCWGYNNAGELGDAGACGVICPMPVDVIGLTSGAKAISAFAHTCAVTENGGVKCWGVNFYGQLGDGQACGTACTSPVDVSGLTSGIAGVSAGGAHTCAVTESGGAKCWGVNAIGQLGDGQACGMICTTPTDVSMISGGAVAVGAGLQHACALVSLGNVVCWGDNVNGQLGDDKACGRFCTTPASVSGMDMGVFAVSAGGVHSCALGVLGAVKCWGNNVYGQLGKGGGASSTPVYVLGGDGGPDTDNDGCTDKAEIATSPGSEQFGGRRDPLDSWDFFDTDGNKQIDLIYDIFNVAGAFGLTPADAGYSTALDRSAPSPGALPWAMGPPDGIIDLNTDIFGVAFQFGHDCS